MKQACGCETICIMNKQAIIKRVEHKPLHNITNECEKRTNVKD